MGMGCFVWGVGDFLGELQKQGSRDVTTEQFPKYRLIFQKNVLETSDAIMYLESKWHEWNELSTNSFLVRFALCLEWLSSSRIDRCSSYHIVIFGLSL
mmetsp:Transcript_24030/g.49644  ORF Transcript_24030/g.49644 Transcript_24030/m.49644 type:complete len:98 (+) Transcript_24030:731-1024(+)